MRETTRWPKLDDHPEGGQGSLKVAFPLCMEARKAAIVLLCRIAADSGRKEGTLGGQISAVWFPLWLAERLKLSHSAAS